MAAPAACSEHHGGACLAKVSDEVLTDILACLPLHDAAVCLPHVCRCVTWREAD